MGKKTSNTASAAEKAKAVADFLDSQGGIGIETLALENAFTDVMIIVEATSRRHAQGLADGVARLCKENGWEFLGMEGYGHARWILVDCNDVIVNIFMEDERALYKLDELWARCARMD